MRLGDAGSEACILGRTSKSESAHSVGVGTNVSSGDFHRPLRVSSGQKRPCRMCAKSRLSSLSGSDMLSRAYVKIIRSS
eukprot:1590433-Amphidinium_carterae.1